MQWVQDLAHLSDHAHCTMYTGKCTSGEKVAVKVLKKKVFEWDEVLKLPEVGCLRRVKHPHVVRLLEVRKDEGDVSLVFERAEHVLGKMPDMGGRIEEIQDWARKIFYQVASGVCGLHSHGIIHRDIRAANIYSIDGKWVLGGFKEAKYVRRKRAEVEQEEGNSFIQTPEKGDLNFRSPESLFCLPHTYSTDIFSLGVLFLELLTGKVVFDAKTTIDQISQLILMMGTEELQDWHQGWSIYKQVFGKSAIQTTVPKRLSYYLPDNVSQDALLLADSMLRLDPNKRATILEVLQHPFFFPQATQKHTANEQPNTPQQTPEGLQPALDNNPSQVADPRPDSAVNPLVMMLGGNTPPS